MTSRASGESFRRAGVTVASPIELDALGQEPSELLLWRRRLDKGDKGDEDVPGTTEELRAGINGLVKEERGALAWLASGEGLGGLPLALEQVGSYVGAQNKTFAAYKDMYLGVYSRAFEEKDT